MLLGDVLAALGDEATATEAILGLDDLAMLTAIREQAASNDLDLGVYVAGTVRRYAAEASDQEWVTLMGMLNRSQDPGTICLKRALAYALREQR